MSKEWLKGTIIKIAECAPETRRYWLEIDRQEPFQFEPGQFVTLDLPIGEKPKDRWRSYSIASAPNEDNIIELVIVNLEGGKGTTYLFEEAEVGTELDFMGPLGKFVLPLPVENDICFVCTGTGIAPFRSMLLDIYQRGIETPPLYLIFGTRHIDDILYFEEMEKLHQKWDNFHYIVTLSREQSSKWAGKKGYVHSVYEDIFHDLRPADFYLCGWRKMVNEAKDRIEAMGYPPESVHREVYD